MPTKVIWGLCLRSLNFVTSNRFYCFILVHAEDGISLLQNFAVLSFVLKCMMDKILNSSFEDWSETFKRRWVHKLFVFVFRMLTGLLLSHSFHAHVSIKFYMLYFYLIHLSKYWYLIFIFCFISKLISYHMQFESYWILVIYVMCKRFSLDTIVRLLLPCDLRGLDLNIENSFSPGKE